MTPAGQTVHSAVCCLLDAAATVLDVCVCKHVCNYECMYVCVYAQAYKTFRYEAGHIKRHSVRVISILEGNEWMNGWINEWIRSTGEMLLRSGLNYSMKSPSHCQRLHCKSAVARNRPTTWATARLVWMGNVTECVLQARFFFIPCSAVLGSTHSSHIKAI